VRMTHPLKSAALALVALLATQLASAQPAASSQPDAYAVEGPQLSFFDTPNRRHTLLKAGEATVLAKVSVTLAQASDVLVQFSSGIATVGDEGCPCSVRVSLQVDRDEPVVIKRINLAAGLRTLAGAFQPDRQSADGSFVYPLPPGAHTVTLVAQRIEGESKLLHAFYQNMQAIPFPRPGVAAK
jgi:hypothetical protein